MKKILIHKKSFIQIGLPHQNGIKWDNNAKIVVGCRKGKLHVDEPKKTF